MGESLPRSISGAAADERGRSPLSFVPTEPGESSSSVDLLSVLRQSLSEGSQPPAAIMHAATEAARILAGADGVALALRTKGVIVCRARSGDPTPELGSALNTDSGISGECMRAASILVCDDTENDKRVDWEVCRDLGIRSIVVVPLRGPIGIAGILEAFSTRTHNFGDEQINALRRLAEIAEAAYEREVRTLQEAGFASLRSARSKAIFKAGAASEPTADKQLFEEVSLARRYWVLGIGVAAVLLVAGVWLSGREPGPEAAGKAAPTAAPTAIRSVATEAPAPTLLPVKAAKPKAAISPTDKTQGSAATTLKTAAAIEPTEDSQPAEIDEIGSGPRASVELKRTAPASEPSPDPPSITVASSAISDPLAQLGNGQKMLPKLDAAVSQGITGGKLLRRLDPVYPEQARAQRLAGTVTLEMTASGDGSVRDVKRVSGSPLLAAAASEAVGRWRYSPFLLNGKPVEVREQVTIIFKLP